MLPYEMGKLFKLQILGLKGNPLSSDILTLYSEVNGTEKILSLLLDNLPSKLPPPNYLNFFFYLTQRCRTLLSLFDL